MIETNLLADQNFVASHPKLVSVVRNTRKEIEAKYGSGTDLRGKCIEASELLVKRLKSDYKVETFEGWVQYGDYGCEVSTDTSYEAHTWVKAVIGGEVFHIDVTGDQFNWGLDDEDQLDPAYIGLLPLVMWEERPENLLDDDLDGDEECDYDDYTATYEVVSSWENHQNIDVTITKHTSCPSVQQ
jgi:hypothetical protein